MGDSGDRRTLRLGQPALPAAPARRRPPRRLAVGRLKACCLAGTAARPAFLPAVRRVLPPELFPVYSAFSRRLNEQGTIHEARDSSEISGRSGPLRLRRDLD